MGDNKYMWQHIIICTYISIHMYESNSNSAILAEWETAICTYFLNGYLILKLKNSVVGAGKIAQHFLLLQRTQVQFPAPTTDSPQLSLTIPEESGLWALQTYDIHLHRQRHIYIKYKLKSLNMKLGWRDGSELESTGCSPRGHCL